MIVEFITNHVFMCSIVLCGVCSIFVQWLMSLSMKGYVKASANMKTTKKKVMINLKNQFETIYGMDYQVRNISAYVEKYLLKMRFLGFSFSFWEKVPFLSAGIATLLAGGMAFYTYNSNGGSTVMTEIVFSYGIVLACFFLFFHIFGIKGKKQQIHIQLVDYLENYLTNRMLRNREASREMKLLDEAIEDVFVKSASNKREWEEILPENGKEKEEMAKLPARNSDEDIQMLLNLVKEMDRNSVKAGLPESEVQEQIAVGEESFVEIIADKELMQADETEKKGKSDIELLEEFVQSFLA